MNGIRIAGIHGLGIAILLLMLGTIVYFGARHYFPRAIVQAKLKELKDTDSELKIVESQKDESRYDSSAVPSLPDLPTNLAEFYGVSGEAPNKLLYSWLQIYERSSWNRANVTQDLFEREVSKTKSFNCSRILLDDSLKNAIKNSAQLEYLYLGSQANSEDLEWIANLPQLRGLSLRSANLKDAELSVLNSLKKLQWLDLRSAKIPPARKSRLPTFNKLEVLFADAQLLEDDHLHRSRPFPQLRVFSATNTSITDAGLTQLVKTTPHLRSLNLFRCKNITTKSMEPLGKLKHLRYLHIGETPLESSVYDQKTSSTPELQELLPKCAIVVGN